MSRVRKGVLVAGGAVMVASIVTLVAAVLLLRSGWLKDELKRQVVLRLEQSTGATVEMQSFDYRWQTWTATAVDFTMRGTEPRTGPPLFHANRIGIGLKLISFFDRRIHVESIEVDRPNVFVIVRADGTTNFPAPRPRGHISIDSQLLALAVTRFELKNGELELDGRRYPLHLSARNVRTVLRFNHTAAAYQGFISAEDAQLESPQHLPVVASLKSELLFARDHISLDQFQISTAHSQLSGWAALDHFSRPIETVQVDKASIDVPEALGVFRVSGFRNGYAEVSGRGTYTGGQFRLAGQIDAKDVEYTGWRFRPGKISLKSYFAAQNDGLLLSDLHVRALGAESSGGAELSNYRLLRWKGHISGLDVKDVAAVIGQRTLAWDGVANGPFSVEGRIGERLRDFIVRMDATIAPARYGLPLSGTASVTYRQKDNSVDIAQSSIQLPHSAINAFGTPGRHVEVSLSSTNLDDLQPVIALLSTSSQPSALPVRLSNGNMHFAGSIDGPIASPVVSGELTISNWLYGTSRVESADASFQATSDRIVFQTLKLQQDGVEADISGSVGLANWRASSDSPLGLSLNMHTADVAQVRAAMGLPSRVTGEFTVSAKLAGTVAAPQGTANIAASNLNIQGQQVDAVHANLKFDPKRIEAGNGLLRLRNCVVTFEASYDRIGLGWESGRVDLRASTNGIPLQAISLIKDWEPGFTGQIQTRGHVTGMWHRNRLFPESVDGDLTVSNVALNGTAYGNLTATVTTKQGRFSTELRGRLRDSDFAGTATAVLANNYDAHVSVTVAPLKLSSVAAMIPQLRDRQFPFEGVVQGETTLDGPLSDPVKLTGSVRLNQLQLSPIAMTSLSASPSALTVRNTQPIVINFREGKASIRDLRLAAKDTQISANGTIALTDGYPLNGRVNGDINLALLKTLNPTIVSAGNSHIDTTIGGTMLQPSVNGTVSINDGSLYRADLTNGFDHANGVIRFDNHRATIQRLTATTGGGRVEVTGLMTFGENIPVGFRVSATARNVRVRYNGVSVTLDADTRYTGTFDNSMLTGTVTVTRGAFNPNTDVGNLVAAYSSQAPLLSPQNGYLHRVQLDLAIVSSPALQLTTSVTQDVQAEIDLHLRGTPDSPVVLGRCSIDEGQIQFFGNKYSINRGEVNFFNPNQIEPVLDLDLQTQASGVTINITVTGTLEKLNVNYRSDPPLAPNEIVALLATGRAPNAGSGYATSQLSQNAILSAGANTILGSAISPVSSRLQRFFGVTHLKIDPMVQGIEDVPQARLTLEQQISPEVSITYVTNLSRTAEQIFRLEWTLNSEYSVVAIRDENGLFGVDIQYKRRFK